MQTASSMFWTPVAMCIANDDNYDTISVSNQ